MYISIDYLIDICLSFYLVILLSQLLFYYNIYLVWSHFMRLVRISNSVKYFIHNKIISTIFPLASTSLSSLHEEVSRNECLITSNRKIYRNSSLFFFTTNTHTYNARQGQMTHTRKYIFAHAYTNSHAHTQTNINTHTYTQQI